MSRIIVKGLPKYLTEEKLRDHFAKKGDITDVKLRRNKSGESRRFAFIGFRNIEDAEEAVRYFNGSFIDTSKIEVDLAKSFVDPSVPKSFKEKKREAYERVRQREIKEQEREERERERKRQKTDKRAQIDKEIENDPHLKEFIETMKPSTQAKSWSNDVVINADGAPSNSLLDKALAMKSDATMGNKFENEVADEIFKVQENESDDEYNDFGKVPAQEEQHIEEDEPMTNIDAFESQQNKNEEQMSDMEWLRMRRVRIKENGEIVDDRKNTKNEATSASEESQEQQQPQEQKQLEEPEEPQQSEEESAISRIQKTGRLFLRNILYTASEDDFTELFQPFGELDEVHIAVDTRNGQSKGFAYIKFADPQNAINAYIELDKQIFQGRLLHILPADDKKDHRLDEFDLKNLPLKKQRELKKKNDASKSQFSWNSLYMNTDAVMNSIAANLGIDKRELIDPENSNSAVKQALAEAHVIGDVRKFFESKGIDLTKFQGKERDDGIILIKNFPYGTTEAELLELFQPFGDLKRLIMPPSGTIAIIQYRDLPSGRSAFSKLCYRRFKKSILYLEKGPKDLFTREPTEGEGVGESDVPVKEEDVKEIKENAKDLIEDTGDTEVFEGPTVSVFVKNLNFTTTAQDLSEIFKVIDGFIVATIKTKPDPRDSTKKQSMGFGFAEFKTKDQANLAIKTLDNTVLDGHKLQLKLSHRQNVVNKSTTKNKTISSKIIVKNLPFETTRKDVFELFNSFGQLKSVRVPKKFDKSARGFAFVEFLLPKEAESAMDQLQGVHLLGRRLVMQFAEQSSDDVEEEIEKMTKKVKKQVASRELGAVRNNSKRKFNLGDNDDDEEGGGIDDI